MTIFTAIVYQPFFNLLVFFYYLLEQIPGNKADMGVAVILLTLAIRILMLPLTIAGTRSKGERHAIEKAIKKIKKTYTNPAQQKEAIRKIFLSNKRVLTSESINFFIQLIIFFILYRIFTTGLEGADFHLLYDFMPRVTLPFNLYFIGTYDLAHPNLFLNLAQSITILAVEALSLINSPFPNSRNDVIRYLIILPLASFFIFMFLPAGKKLFIITTLWFSFFFTLTDILSRFFSSKFDPEKAS